MFNSSTHQPSALSLHQAIEKCYTVFESYSHLPLGEGSPISVSREMRLPLEQESLHSLSVKDLNPFVFKTLSTWGNEDDLRHFLPRILELIAGEAFHTWLGIYRFFGKLKDGDLHKWPKAEQMAIEAYCQALWLTILEEFPVSDNPYDSPANIFLLNIDEIGDVQPYLDSWPKSPSGILHLANLLIHYGLPYQDKETGIIYHVEWLKNSRLSLVRDWLISAEHLQMLEAAFFAHPDKPLLEMAINSLFWTLKQRGQQ